MSRPQDAADFGSAVGMISASIRAWFAKGTDTQGQAAQAVLVNQCLDTPPDTAVRFAPNALSARGRENGAAVRKRRVLLLDDDPAFNEAVREFLVESDYSVVAVANGAEGVREVLAGDFSLVLCDMMMPTLPGDLFFRAVERISPGLCDRFVFMTGYREDVRANEFITKIDGHVLRKPFHLTDLLVADAVAEVRSSFKSVVGSGGRDPAVEGDRWRAARGRTGAHLLVRGPYFPEVAKPRVRAEADAAPRVQPVVMPDPRRQPRQRALVVGAIVAGVALIVLAGLRGVGHYRAVRDGAAAAVAEQRAREEEWKATAVQLDQANSARSRFASLPQRLKRLAEERATGGWAETLRVVAGASGPEIDWRSVTARGVGREPRACEIHLVGVATGSAPRVMVNDFYKTLGRELEKRFSGMTVIVLEKVDDEPDLPAASGLHRARFALAVKIGSKPPRGAESGVAK
ncbi:MAG: response regulator [Chthoniobacter sp.]|nr:response regulator [Chthoniobacter sp.]